MIATNAECPPGIALLADHLDTALAVAEDLLASGLPARADLDEADARTASDLWDQAIQRIVDLEASLILRVLQSRRLLGEIGRVDPSLKMTGALFRAEVDVLQTLIMKGPSNDLLQAVGSGDGYAFLRSRGLVAPESAGPSPFEALEVVESFRIGGAVRLGGLMDMIAALLDFLDVRFGLYAEDAAPVRRRLDDGQSHVAEDLPVDEPKAVPASRATMTLADALKAVQTPGAELIIPEKPSPLAPATTELQSTV